METWVLAGIIKDSSLIGKSGRDLNSIAGDLELAQDVEEFDDILETLYDYADEHRIWLGL